MNKIYVMLCYCASHSAVASCCRPAHIAKGADVSPRLEQNYSVLQQNFILRLKIYKHKKTANVWGGGGSGKVFQMPTLGNIGKH